MARCPSLAGRGLRSHGEFLMVEWLNIKEGIGSAAANGIWAGHGEDGGLVYYNENWHNVGNG